MPNDNPDDWDDVEDSGDPETIESPTEEQLDEDVEIVDENTGEVTTARKLQSLSTFSEREGSFTFKLIPVVRREGTDWQVNVYSSGVQGPVLQTNEAVSDKSADHLGMSRKLQGRINKALKYAKENLRIPPELGSQKREKRSLHELELLMNEEA